MKIELRRENGELVYSLKGKGITMREVVLDAYKKGIRDFSNCNLRACDLRGCDLSYSNLSHSNLSGSNLSNSDFIACDFSGSDLSNCKKGGKSCQR